MQLQVGQKLWFVSRHRGQHEVEITKVGRKWAQTQYGMRVDVTTLIVDGGQYTSPGRCYLSREEWEAERILSSAWWEFQKAVRDARMPDGLTLADIQEARALLRLSSRPA